MRRFLLIVVLILVLSLPALAGRRIGVLYFDVSAPDDSYDYLATGLAEMMMTDLSNEPDLVVIEREQIDRVLSEIILTGTGITDADQALEVGKILGVELLIMGSMTVVGEQMRLDAQVLFVETGEIAGGVRAESGNLEGVFEMLDHATDLLVDKIRSLRYGSTTTPVIFVDPDSGAPRVDVAFLVDTTGSMGDEIEVVKQKMREIAVEIAQGTPAPAVRFAIVEFRDRGDIYITKVEDFTYDLLDLHQVINGIFAGGGGDGPESVYRALDDGINKLDWESGEVTRLAFLIGDAEPHEYDDEFYTIDDAIKDANKRGISIFTIGCSGLGGNGEESFKEVAYGTNGSFEYLSYRKTYENYETGEIASYIYEGSSVYDEEEVRDALASSGVVDEDTDLFATGVGRTTTASEAMDAGEIDTESDAYGSGGGVGAMTAAPTSVSDETRYKAEARAAEMGADDSYVTSTSSVVSVENNLDSLITQVIQSNMATRGVSYDMGVAQARVLVRQGDSEYWIPVTDSMQIERLQEAADGNETLWLAAGVRSEVGEDDEKGMAFRAGTLDILDGEAAAPVMTHRSIADLEEDPDYYMHNGLGDNNQWSLEVEVLSLELE